MGNGGLSVMETEVNSSSSIKGATGAHSIDAYNDGNSVVYNPAPFEGEKCRCIPHQTAVDFFSFNTGAKKKVPPSSSWP